MAPSSITDALIRALTDSIKNLGKITEAASAAASKNSFSKPKVKAEPRREKKSGESKETYNAYLKDLKDKNKFFKSAWDSQLLRPMVKSWNWFVGTKMVAGLKNMWGNVTGFISKQLSDVFGELTQVVEMMKNMFKTIWGTFKDIGVAFWKILGSPLSVIFGKTADRQLAEEKKHTGLLRSILEAFKPGSVGSGGGGGSKKGKKSVEASDQVSDRAKNREFFTLLGANLQSTMKTLRKRFFGTAAEKSLIERKSLVQKRFEGLWDATKKTADSAIPGLFNGILTAVSMVSMFAPLIGPLLALATPVILKWFPKIWEGIKTQIFGTEDPLTSKKTRSITQKALDSIRDGMNWIRDEKKDPVTGKAERSVELDKFARSTLFFGEGLLPLGKVVENLATNLKGMRIADTVRAMAASGITPMSPLYLKYMLEIGKVAQSTSISRFAGVFSALSKIPLMKKLPLIGDVVEGYNTFLETGDVAKSVMSGFAHAGGRLAAGWAGAKIGGMLGLFFGPTPLGAAVGAVGALAGGLLGLMFGPELASKISKYLYDKFGIGEAPPVLTDQSNKDLAGYYEKLKKSESSGVNVLGVDEKDIGNMRNGREVTSTASGYFGITNPTWDIFKPNSSKYTRAGDAPESEQLEAIQKYTAKSIKLLNDQGLSITEQNLKILMFGHGLVKNLKRGDNSPLGLSNDEIIANSNIDNLNSNTTISDFRKYLQTREVKFSDNPVLSSTPGASPFKNTQTKSDRIKEQISDWVTQGSEAIQFGQMGPTYQSTNTPTESKIDKDIRTSEFDNRAWKWLQNLYRPKTTFQDATPPPDGGDAPVTSTSGLGPDYSFAHDPTYLNPEFRAQLGGALSSVGLGWDQLISGYRTDQRQEWLVKQKQQNPRAHPGPVAAKGKSRHRTGFAADMGNTFTRLFPEEELNKWGLTRRMPGNDAMHIEPIPGSIPGIPWGSSVSNVGYAKKSSMPSMVSVPSGSGFAIGSANVPSISSIADILSGTVGTPTIGGITDVIAGGISPSISTMADILATSGSDAPIQRSNFTPGKGVGAGLNNLQLASDEYHKLQGSMGVGHPIQVAKDAINRMTVTTIAPTTIMSNNSSGDSSYSVIPSSIWDTMGSMYLALQGS